MSEQPPVESPDPIPASEFSIATSVASLLLLIGHKRIGFVPGEDVPRLGTGWTTALTLSPTSAKMLIATLSKAVADYESDYGKIPIDEKQGPTTVTLKKP